MALALAAAAAGGCAFLHETNAEPEGAPRKETLWAVTDAAELIRINAGQPRRVLERRRLAGLPAGERLLGIDYRVARGTLYALSSGGHLYTLGTKSGRLTRLGKGPAITLAGMRFAAAAYTYNKHDERLTTNYAIDTRAGTLVMQGSREGVQPVVSPNTGTVSPSGRWAPGRSTTPASTLPTSATRRSPRCARTAARGCTCWTCKVAAPCRWARSATGARCGASRSSRDGL